MLIFFARYMLMHYHALFLSFLSFLSIVSCCVFCLLFSIVSLTWLPRNLLLRRTQYLVVVLHLLLLFLLFLLEIGVVIRTPKRISIRTFVVGQFIRNAKPFYLTFQTRLFPVHLALGVGISLWKAQEVSRRVYPGVLL